MVWVLAGAAGLSALLGEARDAAVIGAILVLNAVLGFIQEFRAERSLETLKRLAAPQALVIRDGRAQRVAATELAPGDLIRVAAGDRAPADARLISASSLEVSEAVLTGESLPVSKDAAWIGRADTPLAERRNMLYMGTAVNRGHGLALVTATGMETEMGGIARDMQAAQSETTPLQKRLDRLGRRLVAACAMLVGLVFAAGLARGLPAGEMLMTAVSLAVAVIPEGIPAVVTIALALGVQRMIRRRAVIRRLPAVETLGCATVICSDKTGTLTKNEMTVVKVLAGETELEVSGQGYAPVGAFYEAGRRVEVRSRADVRLLLEIGVLCNHALLKGPDKVRKAEDEETAWEVFGDPTEGALLAAGRKAGLHREILQRRYPQAVEHPFDAERRRMSVIVRFGDGLRVLAKGAPHAILERCRFRLVNGRVEPLDPLNRRRLEDRVRFFASQGLRVLAMAFRDLKTPEETQRAKEMETCESGLVFVGLAAIGDPPRPEARKAIAKAAAAGVRTLMLTGDHPSTAWAVARQLGLGFGGDPPSAAVATGAQIEKMNEAALKRTLRRVGVFARVSPAHKLRIVEALKADGEVVAMTGDGVNDAPAVRAAHIGVSMGKTGAETTREASAMVLTDDNYATIVAAIEEGRGVYENIRRFIRYLLTCNVGEVACMLAALLAGLPLPLTPLQILWMNLVTDGLPAVALGAQPAEENVMKRPPRPVGAGLINRPLAVRIAAQGAWLGLNALAPFVVLLSAGAGVERARTAAFCTLVLAQLFFAVHCRARAASGNRKGQRLLGAALAVSAAMQAATVYWAPLQKAFSTSPLNAGDWLWVLLFAGWSQFTSAPLRVLGRRVLRRVVMVRA